MIEINVQFDLCQTFPANPPGRLTKNVIVMSNLHAQKNEMIKLRINLDHKKIWKISP